MAQAHYYGDRVRALIMTAGIAMVLTMPFFSNLIPKPIFLSILAVLFFIVLSGMLSPRHKMMMIITTIVTAAAFVIFQYYALMSFQALGAKSSFFLINEFLALVFLIATYFGTKSVRGLTLAEGL